jgi:tetratricopeptide (TPR) repeat protein
VQARETQSARKVLEFVFAREIDQYHLEAVNFLGLAEARIKSGDTPGAVQLLRRLVLVVGDPYEHLNSAAALLEKTGRNAQAVEFLDQLVRSAPWDHSYALRLAKARTAAARDLVKSHAALATTASSADSPYGLRLEAAFALSAVRGTSTLGTLGSTELNLLAGDTRAIGVTAADQPFFSDARLKTAANLTDSRAKIELLGKALSDAPGRTDVRVALFQAAASLQEDPFSLAAISPLLNLRYPRSTAAGYRFDENQGVPSNVNIPAGVSARQWPLITASIGDAMTRLDHLSEALPYFETALKLERVAPRRTQLIGKITAVQSRLRREEANQARAPILHEALEQQRLVRPRLVAQDVTPAAQTGGQRP